MIIYLDIDGVLANFIEAACNALNIPVKEPLTWYWNRELGIDDAEFWAAINAKGEDFWTNLREYPHARELYRTAVAHGDVTFCSTPSRDPYCFSGKIKWLQKFTGQKDFRVIFITDKSQLSRPGRYLIDDNEDSVKAFAREGGCAILYPQPWNSPTGTIDVLREEFWEKVDSITTMEEQRITNQVADWRDNGR
jgi:5'(3')-deoxyribonucleotidase